MDTTSGSSMAGGRDGNCLLSRAKNATNRDSNVYALPLLGGFRKQGTLIQYLKLSDPFYKGPKSRVPLIFGNSH